MGRNRLATHPRIALNSVPAKLTLKDALKKGDLEQFIALAEAEGFGGANAEAFKRAITAAVKPQPEERQTSTGPSRGGSGGK